MPTVRPFGNIGGHTIFDNAALDLVMPKCKPNTWKVVCATLRKTAGWADPLSPTKRKQSDLISLSQYHKLTGIVGRTTLVNAVMDALDNNYIVRIPSGLSFKYAININFQIVTGTEIVPLTGTEIVPLPVRKSYTQRQTIKQTDKQKDKKRKYIKEKAPENNSGENSQPPLIPDLGEDEAQAQQPIKRGPGRPRKNPQDTSPVKGKAKPAGKRKAKPVQQDGGPDQTPQVAPNPPTKPPDPRADAPAVVAVREIISRGKKFPAPETWDLLIAKLGDNPDRERLKTCFAVWRSHDYRATNLAWALTWYFDPPPEVLAQLAPAAQVIRRIPAIRGPDGKLLEPDAAIAAYAKMEAARRAKLNAPAAGTKGETSDATTTTTNGVQPGGG